MGFDLRKPKIYQDFGLSNAVGISSYLINKNTLDEIIQNRRLIILMSSWQVRCRQTHRN
jgi:tyrosine-protein kinase Etk/Wzc